MIDNTTSDNNRPSGKYEFLIERRAFDDTSSLASVLKAMFATWLITGIIISSIILSSGGWDAFLNFGKYYLLSLLGIWLLSTLCFYLLGLLKGKRRFSLVLTDMSVVQNELGPANRKSDLPGCLMALGGLLALFSGRRSPGLHGLRANSRISRTVMMKDVRKVETRRGNILRLRLRSGYSDIYLNSGNIDFIREFISSHIKPAQSGRRKKTACQS